MYRFLHYFSCRSELSSIRIGNKFSLVSRRKLSEKVQLLISSREQLTKPSHTKRRPERSSGSRVGWNYDDHHDDLSIFYWNLGPVSCLDLVVLFVLRRKFLSFKRET